jgi:hypothetical protein
MNDSLIKPRPYDSAKEFVPITLTALIPIAFVVNSQLPIATLAAESAAVLTATGHPRGVGEAGR